jgi:xanthine/CO dehydrogenase XdhC/CoxF family maturation factor
MWRRKLVDMATVIPPGGPIAGRELVAQRAAEAMLRTLGATQITLRAAMPTMDSTGNQLGLTCSGFEDVLLSPVVVRSTAFADNETVKVEVLVSATAAQAAAIAHGVDDVATWLLEAHGVLYRSKLLHIDSVIVDHFAGSEYLYHILASE